jgi:hypothetical protein
MQIRIILAFTNRLNTKYMFIVAVMAGMLIGATALATDDALADKKKKSYETSQAVAQDNYCGNGEPPLNVGCQNTASQIQGDEKAAALKTE